MQSRTHTLIHDTECTLQSINEYHLNLNLTFVREITMCCELFIICKLLTVPPSESGWSLFQVVWYVSPCTLVYSCWHLGRAVPQSSASSDPISVTHCLNKTYTSPSINLWCNISESGILGEIKAAVDINTLANKVYQHNFPDTKLLQRNIQSLSAKEINDYCIDMILMSPPCQPFTRWESALCGSTDKKQYNPCWIC